MLVNKKAEISALELDHFEAVSRILTLVRLHAAGGGASDVVATVAEVLLNFAGIGQFALFAYDESTGVLFALHREGDEEPEQDVAISEIDNGALATTGGPWLPPCPLFGANESRLGWLQLHTGRRLIGALRLDALLSQKDLLNSADTELLSLISEHGAIALENAWYRPITSQTPLSRRILEDLVKA